MGALRGQGLVYACDCARSTFAAWEADRGRPWRGIGCPGGCRERALPEDEGTGLRVAVGAGTERWVDLLAGPLADETGRVRRPPRARAVGQLDVRLLRGGRRRPAGCGPGDPGAGPPGYDAGPGPAGPAPGPRDPAAVGMTRSSGGSPARSCPRPRATPRSARCSTRGARRPSCSGWPLGWRGCRRPRHRSTPASSGTCSQGLDRRGCEAAGIRGKVRHQLAGASGPSRRCPCAPRHRRTYQPK